MIKPWNERVRHSVDMPMADETVATVFQGFAALTQEGWPVWAAQRLMKDYPVFDNPTDYTYGSLVHYAVARLCTSGNPKKTGKDLSTLFPDRYGSKKAEEDALYDLLALLLVEPLIFLSHNQKESVLDKRRNDNNA